MHPLLARQLRKVGADEASPPAREQWTALLARISQTYAAAEQDRYMLERSLDTSSAEMQELYDELRRSSEAEVVKSLALARAVQESVADGLVVIDADGKVVSHNSRFLDMWAIPAEAVRADPSVLSPERIAPHMRDPQGYLALARAAIADRELVEAPHDMELTDGRVFERCSAPFRTADGAVSGRVVCYRDVSEQRRLAAQRVVVSERMAAVGQLVASVAHEINNPLAYVAGNVQYVTEALAERRRDEDAPLREALDDVRVGVDRIAVIVRDLRALSRADEETRAPVELRNVVESAIDMANNHIRHRARLVRALGPAPRVLANDARLAQVLLNLLVNAAHAIPEGRASDNEIRVVTRTADTGHAVVEVHDTGSGIPADALERIFDPFFTTKPVGAGTGLGLSICRGIIDKLGGRIRVESTPGVGTCFSVELPATSDGARGEPLPGRGAAGPRAQRDAAPRRRVLVVDDDAQVRKWLQRVLRDRHEVTAVASVDDAVRELDARPFDAILCDVMMPDRTGLDMHAHVARERPELLRRIVFMSGGAFTPALQAFFEQFDGVRLDKPVREPELAKAIELAAAA